MYDDPVTFKTDASGNFIGFGTPTGTTMPATNVGMLPPSGDQSVISRDTSPFREGSNSLLTTGAMYTLAGDLVMKYWSHNCALDVNGNFLPRDDAGPAALMLFTEGIGTNAPKYMMYSNPTGAAGSAQGTFVSVYGIDLTSGDITRPYTDSSGTPGAATINTPRGKAAFLASASTVVITNSLVTATSHIVATLEGTDGTLTSIIRVLPTAGSFTVTGNAACTAAVAFKFSVLN